MSADLLPLAGSIRDDVREQWMHRLGVAVMTTHLHVRSRCEFIPTVE